jgi:hypothetical protein
MQNKLLCRIRIIWTFMCNQLLVPDQKDKVNNRMIQICCLIILETKEKNKK